MPKQDEEDEKNYIYRFGYQYRIPQTNINLYINKKDGRINIKRGNFKYGWDEVENVVYEFIKNEIKKKNLYLKTNLNGNEFIIK